jgi:hypothetical protein
MIIQCYWEHAYLYRFNALLIWTFCVLRNLCRTPSFRVTLHIRILRQLLGSQLEPSLHLLLDGVGQTLQRARGETSTCRERGVRDHRLTSPHPPVTRHGSGGLLHLLLAHFERFPCCRVATDTPVAGEAKQPVCTDLYPVSVQMRRVPGKPAQQYECEMPILLARCRSG